MSVPYKRERERERERENIMNDHRGRRNVVENTYQTTVSYKEK